MVGIVVTDEFKKRFTELPLEIQKKAQRRELLFRQNPFYPSLQTEKLEPRGKQVWSFRIDREYRIIFRFIDNNKVLFLVCGHHHWVYRYKF